MEIKEEKVILCKFYFSDLKKSVLPIGGTHKLFCSREFINRIVNDIPKYCQN